MYVRKSQKRAALLIKPLVYNDRISDVSADLEKTLRKSL